MVSTKRHHHIDTFFTVASLNLLKAQSAQEHDPFTRITSRMSTMKKLVLLSVALGTSGLSLAQQEQGRVISTTPIIQQVTVPRQVCSPEQVTTQQPKSGAGALMGAIAGGAMGNAVGGGNGKTAATMLGLIGGAVVGDSIEGAPQTQTQTVQRCRMQNFYENRTVAYNVAYEYAGKQYSVQMPYDPSPSIALQITPVISNSHPAPAGTVIYPQR